MMWLLGAALSFVLDLLLGDPEKLLHPVVVMGKAISRLEKILRAGFPKTPRGERAAGFVLALLLPVGTLAVTILALWAVGLIHPTLRFALGVFWGWQALALKGLNTESKRVYTALTTGTIEDARKAVSRIVGRDTQRLDEAGVTRAAVETVAENFSDGVLAPLFYLLLGGAPLALCYKAINTMDSMVGYKNERYLSFGRCAARLDDAANWLPARLSALLLVLVSARKQVLDSLDRQILKLISQDARIPFLEVARACNVSGAAIHQRVAKLSNLGIIKGSQFIIDPEKIGYETCAYMGLFLKEPEKFDQVVEELKKIPEVVECHYTTGGFDMFIKIYAINNHHLLEIIHDKLQPLGLSRSETIISFNAAINRQLSMKDLKTMAPEEENEEEEGEASAE